MRRFFEDQFAAGAGRVVLIGSDSPTLPTEYIHRAFQALRDNAVVLGPAADGGYYLVGLKHPHRRLFEAIPWSTNAVMAATLERAREIGLPVSLLPTWYDIDDASSLALLEAELAGNPLPFAPSGLTGGPAIHTRRLLATRAQPVVTAAD